MTDGDATLTTPTLLSSNPPSFRRHPMGRRVLIFSPFPDAIEPPQPAIVCVSHSPFNFSFPTSRMRLLRFWNYSVSRCKTTERTRPPIHGCFRGPSSHPWPILIVVNDSLCRIFMRFTVIIEMPALRLCVLYVSDANNKHGVDRGTERKHIKTH